MTKLYEDGLVSLKWTSESLKRLVWTFKVEIIQKVCSASVSRCLSGRSTGLFWPIRAWGSTVTPSLRRWVFSAAIKTALLTNLTTSLVFLRLLIWMERSICPHATMWPNSQFRGTMASKSSWVMLFDCFGCILPL